MELTVCHFALFLSMRVKVLVAQSCPTLCDPMDCSPPGSSVRGILQARILGWIAILFSRVSFQPRIKPSSPALQADSLLSETPRKLCSHVLSYLYVH